MKTTGVLFLRAGTLFSPLNWFFYVVICVVVKGFSF